MQCFSQKSRHFLNLSEKNALEIVVRVRTHNRHPLVLKQNNQRHYEEAKICSNFTLWPKVH